MSEQQFDESSASAGPGGTSRAPHTDVARVDAVLETLDRLDELPLEEHVGVFEAAHTELRRSLDPDTAPPAQDTTQAPGVQAPGARAPGAMARVAGASQPGERRPEAQPADQPVDQPTDQP